MVELRHNYDASCYIRVMTAKKLIAYVSALITLAYKLIALVYSLVRFALH